MTVEWREEQIGNICKQICSGGTPKSTNIEYYTNGTIPWLNTKEINFNRIFHTEKNITEKALNSSSAKWIEADSIIVALYGETAGKVAITKIALTTNQACCNLTIDPNKADYNYIYYFLKNKNQSLINLKNGGAQQNLNVKIIKEFSIRLPPLPVQKKIAAILSSLDDKIELNTRMNNVLEEIARALFRRWFVAFEFPDNEGKPYKSAGGKMVESEIGRVPEGWEILSLDKIANFMNGMACQKYPPKEGEESMPVIKIRELRSGNLNETDRVSHHVPEKYYVQNGDVLFSWSGSLMVDIWTSGEGVLNQHLFKVTSNTYQKWFYYFWTKYHLEEFQNIAVDKATTMGHIQRKHLNQAKVIVPNKDTLKRMDMVMVPIIAQIIQNNLEGNVLSELRDELLPKLMSGELSL